MNSKYEYMDKSLTFEITEEIDHNTTEKIRRKMDNEIEKYMPKKIVFDFNNVTFMDSSGIGMLMGRYKAIRRIGGIAELINVKPSIKKIFEMCGLLKVIPINNKAGVA